MQITEVVALPPACCVVCRKGNQAEAHPFVDTLRNTFLGDIAQRTYLCRECVEEAAGLFGFISPERAQELVDAAQAADEERHVAVVRAEAFASIARGIEELQAAPAPKPKAARAKKASNEPAPGAVDVEA